MKNKKSIKLKAAFLLMVFALNTVVGFACAIGVNMGFNSKHHHDEEATEAVVHSHTDGEKHLHQENTGNDSHNKSNHHHEADNHHKAKNDKDNCCNDKVMKFEQLDKSIAQPYDYISPVFFTAFLSSFYYNDVLYSFKGTPAIKYFFRSYHPPISDIRIAIQSFQI